MMIEIGYVLKTHGYKGDLKIRYTATYVEDVIALTVVFIERDGEQLPYFVEKIHPTVGTEAIIHLEGLNNKEEASVFRGCKLFARVDDISMKPSMDEAVSEYIGLEARDLKSGVIGTIEDIYTMTHQDLAVVSVEGKEVLIPLHEELIHEYHPGSGTIIFDLPEGFLEI